MRSIIACIVGLLLGCHGGANPCGTPPNAPVLAPASDSGAAAAAAVSPADADAAPPPAADYAAVWELLDRINGWCASYPGECNLHELPDEFPGQAASGETNGFLEDGLQRLAALGVEVVYNRGVMRYHARAEEDIANMVGGMFSPDHLGPDVFAGILRRAHAQPALYLDVFAVRYLDRLSAADALADLYPTAFLREVVAADPARVQELAGTLLAACRQAIAATPPPADEDSEDGRRLARLRRQAAELAGLAGDAAPAGPAAGGDRIAVYVGVDGVCFSVDGAAYGKYPGYADREASARVSPEALDQAIAALRAAGFFADADRSAGAIDLPPQTFLVAVVDGGTTHEVLFFNQAGLAVPPAYLAALEPLAAATGAPAMQQFLSLNRALAAHP